MSTHDVIIKCFRYRIVGWLEARITFPFTVWILTFAHHSAWPGKVKFVEDCHKITDVECSLNTDPLGLSCLNHGLQIKQKLCRSSQKYVALCGKIIKTLALYFTLIDQYWRHPLSPRDFLYFKTRLILLGIRFGIHYDWFTLKFFSIELKFSKNLISLGP